MESEIVLGEICLRTIYLHNIVMTPVWVSGRYGESCESTVDCDSTVECMNNTCGCQSEEKNVTITITFGSTLTRCIRKDGMWY